MEPLWAEAASAEAGVNLAAQWLSLLSKAAPPSSSQKAFPAFLPGLLCRALAFDPVRSQPGHLFFTLKVTPGITNRYETLHGGVIGSLVETLGCAAIRSASGSSHGFVSDINISYITGTPIKEEVEFEAKVLRVGKSIAVAVVDIRNRWSAKAAAQGRVTVCFDPSSRL